MKILIFTLLLLSLLGCQQDNSESVEAIKDQLELVKQTSQKEYDAIQKEIELLKVDSIDFDAEYEKGQKIIEQQDARYNALLERWEQQADKTDKILEAQARQYNVEL